MDKLGSGTQRHRPQVMASRSRECVGQESTEVSQGSGIFSLHSSHWLTRSFHSSLHISDAVEQHSMRYQDGKLSEAAEGSKGKLAMGWGRRSGRLVEHHSGASLPAADMSSSLLAVIGHSLPTVTEGSGQMWGNDSAITLRKSEDYWAGKRKVWFKPKNHRATTLGTAVHLPVVKSPRNQDTDRTVIKKNTTLSAKLKKGITEEAKSGHTQPVSEPTIVIKTESKEKFSHSSIFPVMRLMNVESCEFGSSDNEQELRQTIDYLRERRKKPVLVPRKSAKKRDGGAPSTSVLKRSYLNETGHTLGTTKSIVRRRSQQLFVPERLLKYARVFA